MYNFAPKPHKYLSIELQMILVVILYIATVLLVYYQYQTTGKAFGIYPVVASIFVVPIYEELIFRGILFARLKKYYNALYGIIISSFMFGIRHVKNIFYHPNIESLAGQIAYTGLIFGPIMAYIYHKTGNVWLCIILHFANNLIAGYVTGLS